MSDNLPMILLAILVVAIGLWFVMKPGKPDTTKVEAPAEPKQEAAPKAAEKPAALVAKAEKGADLPVSALAPETKAPAKPKPEAKAAAVKGKTATKPAAETKSKPAAKPKAAAPAAAVAKAPKSEPKAKAPAKAAPAPKAAAAAGKTSATAKTAPKTAAKAPAKPAAKADTKPVAKAPAKPAAKAAAKPAGKAAAKPAAKPKGPDNLLWIKGLGPKLNTMFIDNGVTSFAQIAGWKEGDIEAMDAKLGNFSGRIARDNFVEQAALLAKGDIASFEAKYGKLDSEN